MMNYYYLRFFPSSSSFYFFLSLPFACSHLFCSFTVAVSIRLTASCSNCSPCAHRLNFNVAQSTAAHGADTVGVSEPLRASLTLFTN